MAGNPANFNAAVLLLHFLQHDSSNDDAMVKRCTLSRLFKDRFSVIGFKRNFLGLQVYQHVRDVCDWDFEQRAIHRTRINKELIT